MSVEPPPHIGVRTNRPSFLGSLRVAEGIFDIGGKIRPSSVRDQIVRARLLTAHLRHYGFLTGNKTMCVVGAGPAGLTVAIEASQHVETWLVEKNHTALSIFSYAAHRLISPTLYDWPAEHHRSHEYLGWPQYCEGRPDLIREEWLRALKKAELRGLRFLNASEVQDIELDGTGPPWSVEIAPKPNANPPERFDLVVLCRGFGQERGLPIEGGGTFKPIPFWEVDPYPAAGRRSLADWSDLMRADLKPAVAVLGGGDGAIQDLLRFVTDGRDSRYILNEIQPFIRPAAASDLAHVIGHVENEMRYKAFGEPPPQLGADFRAKIDSLLERIWTPSLVGVLMPMIRLTSIRLYFRDEFLGPCYPLNRFLAHLFQRCIKEVKGWDILAPGHQANSIVCSDQSGDHFNHDHQVVFMDPENQRIKVPCRVVIPRLGIDPQTVLNQHALDPIHHALPYWLGNWKPKIGN